MPDYESAALDQAILRAATEYVHTEPGPGDTAAIKEELLAELAVLKEKVRVEEERMTNWQIIHAYRRLVEQGKAVPIVHDACGVPLVSQIGPDDEPVLRCILHRATVTPGVKMWTQMREAVERDLQN